jgi:hypothetical protein
MSYQKGNKVRIKNNLNRGYCYGSIKVTNMHLKHSNQETTIIRYDNGYRLALDNGETRWAYDMLELVEERKERDNKMNKDNEKSVYELLKDSIDGLTLNAYEEEEFAELIKNKYSLIYVKDNCDFTYDNLPIIIDWLQNIYKYVTELKEKNKVEYFDFKTAKEHMKNDNGCELDGYFYDKDSEFTIKDIESKEWILL